MPKIKYPIYIQYIVLIVSVAVMSLAVSYFVFAWTAPTKTPPGDNVEPPVNVGSVDQVKTGGLSVGAFISQYGTILAKDSGSVGIGTSSPGARLDVNYPLNSKGFRITSPNYDADKLNAGLTFHSETNVNAQGDIVLYHNGAEDGSALDIWAYPSNSAGGCCHKLASFGVKSDGSEYQYFSGSVGIGTSSPDEKLDVKGVLEVGTGSRGAQFSSTVSDNFVLKTYTNTPNPNLWIGYGNGAGGQDNSREYIAMNGGKIMLMNGNVGIGTTTPSAKLQVRASGNNNPENNGLYVFNTDNAGGDDDAIITARVGGSSAGDPFISLDINGEYGWTVGVDNSDGNKFKIDRGWSDVGENTDFVINVNGNIGIGTTNPDEKLHIEGNVLLNAYAAGAGSGIFFRQGFSPGSAGDNRNVAIRLRGLDSPETPDGLEFDAYDGIVFNTQYNDRMVIKPNGNVGIGVTSPSQKLDVAGYVKGQTGLCIGNDCRTSWPAGSCYVDKSDCEQISEAKLRFPGCPARRPVLNRVDAVCGEGDCWDAPQDTFCCAIKCGEPPLEPCDWSGWKNMPPESYTCTPADCCPHGLPCWGDCPATGTITRRKYCDNTNPAVGGMVVKTEVVSINGCDCTGFCGSIGP